MAADTTLTEMSEIIFYPAPEVSLYKSLNQPPRLLPVAQLSGHPEQTNTQNTEI